MKNATQADEVCTTQRAAEILGVSVSSVQQLVEAGVIEAWKTKGGHRRIPLAAVLAYKLQPAAGSLAAQPAAVLANRNNNAIPTILVVEDNPMQRQLYETQIASWNLQATLTFCENGYQALLEIARRQPDIVLADIVMDGIDGYELINTIVADPLLRPMHIAILSSLDPAQLQARGGVPRGVVFFPKPVNYDELRGYLKACCAQHERNRQ